MVTIYDIINVFIGFTLIGATTYAALSSLLTKIEPNTVAITSSGTVGAIVTLALFALGGVMVVHGLSGGLRYDQ